MKTDFIIRNGRVIDPFSGVDEIRDIAVANGRIVPVNSEISAASTIDATGCWVLPGLIDYHTHLFQGGSTFGTPPDLLLATGVTTAVDMGSAGYINFEAFERGVVKNCALRVRAFINVSPLGQPGGGLNEPLFDKAISTDSIAAMVKAHSDLICGVKVRVSRAIVGELGIRPLERALEIGQECGLPVCVHVTDAPISMGELASMLRPGDIFSHVYHGSGNTIIENGRISPAVLKARERGIIFDLGNGRINFSYETASKAASEGFWPDTITSDSTPATLFRARAMKDLPFVLSKLICLGMPITEAIKSVTATPAHLLGMDGEIGTLSAGATADISVFNPCEKPVTFADSKGTTWQGDFQLLHRLTMQGGKICACASDFMID